MPPMKATRSGATRRRSTGSTRFSTRNSASVRIWRRTTIRSPISRPIHGSHASRCMGWNGRPFPTSSDGSMPSARALQSQAAWRFRRHERFMLRLLGRRTSANVQKVTWLLTALGIAFQMVDVGGEFGGNRTPEYLRLNPNGVVPALIDADTSVCETTTILRYLANRFGQTPFHPSEIGNASRRERVCKYV